MGALGVAVGEARPEVAAREALLWALRRDGSIVCHLCAHRCRIPSGLAGICRVRENRGHTLVTLVGDRVVGVSVEPVEKKPLFHFLPGSLAYSIATVGCNFHCRFCQNWAISQWPRERAGPFPGEQATPRQIVEAALAAGCRSIAYTYTEPTVFFELALQTSYLAAASGLRNLLVTNGYMTRQALKFIASVLDGANVDLKSFSDRYYRKVCGATLAPVLDTIRAMRELGVWVEVTTLLIPDENDSGEELTALTRWLASVDRDMPWHVSAFFPAYRMADWPPTPPGGLHRAALIGRQAGLRFVYTGNVPGDPWEDTACPECGRRLLHRRGVEVLENFLAEGRCPVCDAALAGVWE